MVGFVPYDIRNKPCTAVFSERKAARTSQGERKVKPQCNFRAHLVSYCRQELRRTFFGKERTCLR